MPPRGYDSLQRVDDPDLFSLKQASDHLGLSQVRLDHFEPVCVRHAVVWGLDNIGGDELDVLGCEL